MTDTADYETARGAQLRRMDSPHGLPAWSAETTRPDPVEIWIDLFLAARRIVRAVSLALLAALLALMARALIVEAMTK